MDRNQLIGLFLIGLILIGYSILMQPSKEELQKRQQYLDSLKKAQNTDTNILDTGKINRYIPGAVVNTDTNSDNDSIILIEYGKLYGIFAPAARGEQKTITLKNDLVEIKISTKAGKIVSVKLLNYKTYDQKDLYLVKPDSNIFDLNFFSNGKLISTEKLYFTPLEKDTVFDATKQQQTVHLRLLANENQYVEYTYTLKPGSYLLDYDINFVNLHKEIDPKTTFLDLHWQQLIPLTEKSKEQENKNTTIFYKYYQDDVENLNPQKDAASEDLKTKIRWIDFKKQFFSSFLIAKNYFDEAEVKYTVSKDSAFLKKMSANIQIPFKHGQNVHIPMMYYFGPNKYSILRKIKIGDQKLRMEKVIPLGGSFISIFNKYLIIPLFNFLGKFISNYGLIILLMTLIIKLVLFPLTYRSYVSMAKMKVLKPEIDKIISKIPEDKQLERQQKTMELYRKAGVSPLGGCLPMLLQLPILIAMYRFFPASIELRQKSFLWADDLSTYDAILTWKTHIPGLGDHISLFTLLMAITLVINSLLNNTSVDNNNPQGKIMKFMFMYLMPILMIIWFNNYSAALSYYFFLSTLIGILQTLLIRKFIDEDKLLAQLKTNVKSKKVKKSKWQQRLEELQKQQAKRRR